MEAPVATSLLADDRLETAARVLVPVGAGVLTWLVVAVAVGAVASLSSPTLMSVVLVLALGLLFLPIYRFRPWETGLTDRVQVFVRTRRLTLAVAVLLFVFLRFPFVTDLLGPLVGLLLLPVRAAPQILFGAKLFYADHLSEQVGTLLFRAARLYVEFLWLYTLGTVVQALSQWGEPT